MTPSNLKECFEALDVLLTPENQEFIQNNSEKTVLARTHHALGQWIRNTWGLWTKGPLYKHFEAQGLHHPDDMSGVIITSYYYLNCS